MPYFLVYSRQSGVLVMSRRTYVFWVDSNGSTRLVWYTYAVGGNLLAFSTALEATVQPVTLTSVDGPLVPGTATPGTSPYLSVNDAALLTFSTAVGSTIGLVCPGFSESLYLGDNQTVDPAQPLVIALVAQCIGFLVDGAGNPATAFIGGLRQRRGY